MTLTFVHLPDLREYEAANIERHNRGQVLGPMQLMLRGRLPCDS